MKTMTETRQVPEYSTAEFLAKNNDYCVCVFVINEGDKLLRQLERMQPVCQEIADIVVADGGSRDGSTDREKLNNLGVNTLLVKTGRGKLGSQMRMAFDWALKRGYKGVICVDGNGKDGVEAIPDFVKELQQGIDHVQGSRFIPGGHQENTPKSRLLGLKLLHVPVMRLASGFHYTDTTNGFRAYSARLLSSEKLAVFRNCFSGYELHYYLAIEASRQGFNCSEIPVSRVYPKEGGVPTKISGIRGNFNIIEKLFLCAIGYYRPGRPVPWKKSLAVISCCIAATAIINLLIYAGLGLYLKCSSQALLIGSLRPSESSEKVSLSQTGETGDFSRKKVFCFQAGKNKIFFSFVGISEGKSYELQVTTGNIVYCNDLLMFEFPGACKTIKASDIAKKSECSEINYRIPVLTDSRWINGIGIHHNGFFLNVDANTCRIRKGISVKIDGRTGYSVEGVRLNGKYIEVDTAEKIHSADAAADGHTADFMLPDNNIFSFSGGKMSIAGDKLLHILLIITILESVSIIFLSFGILLVRLLLKNFFRINEVKKSKMRVRSGPGMAKYSFIAAAMAIVMTMVLYPGIIYSDSMERIRTGIAMFSYNNDFISSSQSVASCLLCGLAVKYFGSIAVLSVFHAFLFFFSIFLVCDLLSPRNKWKIIALIGICPFVAGISVYHETNAYALSFILFSFWLMMNPGLGKRKITVWFSSLLLTASLTMLLNLRANTITLVPLFGLLAAVNFIRGCFQWKRLILLLQLIAIAAAVFLSGLLTDTLVKNNYDFSQPGFFWKGISILQQCPGHDYYQKYFDDYSIIPDATSKALKTNENRSFYGMISFFLPNSCQKEKTSSLLKDLAFLGVTHPAAAFNVLKNDFLKLSGIPQLFFDEYDYNRSSNGEFFGIPFHSFFREAFFEYFFLFTNKTKVFLTPWILILLCPGLILLHLLTPRGRRILKKNMVLFVFLFLLAVTYNYTFLVNAQRFEFRYSVPCSIPLLILNLTLFTSLINTVIKRKYFFLNIIYAAGIAGCFLFGVQVFACGPGKKILAAGESQPAVQLRNQSVKIFNVKNRIYVIANQNAGGQWNPRLSITFVPDIVNAPSRQYSLELARMKQMFCGFHSSRKIFYFDFYEFPVKSYIISSSDMSSPVTISSRPDSIRTGHIILSDYVSSQITGCLTLDGRGIFVLTDGTDFAGRYICLRSNRRIRICSGKWYQDGKILYLEESILPHEVCGLETLSITNHP